jgi:hypothetical protein
MCPYKIGEIGQEMIIMARIFLRKRYSTEGKILKKGIEI